MDDAQRQELNVRTIRVSLEAALRSTGPENAEACLGRARSLVYQARPLTTAPGARRDLKLLLRRIDAPARDQNAGSG